ELEKLYGKKITLAERELVEQSDEIVAHAKGHDAALLVIGDPLTATTHLDIIMRARKENVKVGVVHNASITSAVGITGLQVYKFGKTVTIPFPEINFKPEIFYEVLKQNMILGLHTLLLLDLKPKESKFMTIAQAIETLLGIEGKRKEDVFNERTMCIGCARVGSEGQKIAYGTAGHLKKVDFGKPPYSLIVPGELHFMEEEALAIWKLPDGKTEPNQKI
ncbi:diphthine synthase, partial [Candidatus Woesearchaeota archaeon]|nr:diphthine synthase [Candidatus Woesearchaeota archaeon]